MLWLLVSNEHLYHQLPAAALGLMCLLRLLCLLQLSRS
jgi:hypothetical protein